MTDAEFWAVMILALALIVYISYCAGVDKAERRRGEGS